MRPLLCLFVASLASLSLSCKGDDPPPPPPPPECGNGLLETAETCEGMPPPTGCNPSSCTVQMGWSCTPEVPVPTDGATSGGTTEPMEWTSTCEPLDTCGDGVIDPEEDCDDGDATLGDGCSMCVIDPLYVCIGQPSDCHKCGDGFINAGEECDSGIDLGNASRGCTENCEVVPGWECFGEPTLCGPICGDGMWFDTSIPDVTIGFAEQCDDGNLVDGDGCDGSCDIEDGYECEAVAPATSVCFIPDDTTGSDTDGSSGTDTGSGSDTGSGTDTGSGSGSGTAGSTG